MNTTPQRDTKRDNIAIKDTQVEVVQLYLVYPSSYPKPAAVPVIGCQRDHSLCSWGQSKRILNFSS